jgi:hypothetical protein
MFNEETEQKRMLRETGSQNSILNNIVQVLEVSSATFLATRKEIPG